MITIIEIVNLAINGASLLIVGGLAVWIFKFQNEKLSLKDEQIASLKRERDEAISARDERIKLLEQERDAARAVAEERISLANERREAAIERLDELLAEHTPLNEASARRISRIGTIDLTTIILPTAFSDEPPEPEQSTENSDEDSENPEQEL